MTCLLPAPCGYENFDFRSDHPISFSQVLTGAKNARKTLPFVKRVIDFALGKSSLAFSPLDFFLPDHRDYDGEVLPINPAHREATEPHQVSFGDHDLISPPNAFLMAL